MSTLEEKDSQVVESTSTDNVAAEIVLVENASVQAPVANIDYSGKSESELVNMASVIISSTESNYSAIKFDIEQIKDNYYKKFNRRVDEIRKSQQEAGEDAEPVELPVDEFKPVYSIYQEKRNEEKKKKDEEEKANLEAKRALIEQLKELAAAGEAHHSINECRDIQAKWKSIGRVPQQDSEQVNSDYKLWIENFYDNLKTENELRDFDFKKNLKDKEILCDKAESLASASNVVEAFRTLQTLHEMWKETGPVAPEHREEIWERFKAASNVVNKNHREFFEKIHAKEEENLVAKTKLCEEVEAIEVNMNSTKAWQDKSEFILSLQEQWKKIGYAPKKDNDKIYERFRAACDKFFNAKNEFFKSIRESQSDNLAKKIALCTKAEALQESDDWKGASEALTKLQQEWKTIGQVQRKNSDAVWKRFIGACDKFFERRNKFFKDQRLEESQNLAKKKELTEQIKNLNLESESAYDDFKALIAQWNEVGHVPFDQKDVVYKEYKKTIDAVFEKFAKDKSKNKLDLYRTGVQNIVAGGSSRINTERKRLMRQIEVLTGEIHTAENNIGFFSKSKNASSLVAEMQTKIEKLKQEKKVVLEKLAILDENLDSED